MFLISTIHCLPQSKRAISKQRIFNEGRDIRRKLICQIKVYLKNLDCTTNFPLKACHYLKIFLVAFPFGLKITSLYFYNCFLFIYFSMGGILQKFMALFTCFWMEKLLLSILRVSINNIIVMARCPGME